MRDVTIDFQHSDYRTDAQFDFLNAYFNIKANAQRSNISHHHMAACIVTSSLVIYEVRFHPLVEVLNDLRAGFFRVLSLVPLEARECIRTVRNMHPFGMFIVEQTQILDAIW